MPSNARSLMDVYKRWDGYNVGLVHAAAPLTPVQLAWRPAPNLRSVGEIERHIVNGRIGWFQRIPAVGSAPFAGLIGAGSPATSTDDDANLVKGLETTWHAIKAALTRWTMDNLAEEFHLPYQGKTWRVPRQWIIWRILSHDVHHGGEFAISLGIQGIAIPELGGLGGHLTQLEVNESPSKYN